MRQCSDKLHQYIHTLVPQDSNHNTSLIIAIRNEHESAAEVLVAATAHAGALDVQVDWRGAREYFWVDGCK